MSDEAYPGSHVCGVCGRVLDRHSLLGWRHTLADADADHDPVPVPRAQATTVKGRCDFCSDEEPQWILPAKDFEVLKDHISHGDWSACDKCAALIRKGRWYDIVDRASAIWARKEGRPMPAEVQNSLHVMYALLRKNLAGELRPVNPPGSPTP